MSEFDTLFDQFKHTAFRLEGRAAYDVGGQEAVRLAAWRDRQPRPERSVRTDPWLARIATTTAAGKRWSRLRVVDEPLSDYERFELFSGTYLEALACGDDTRVVRRSEAGPAAEHADFWLFDRGTTEVRGFLMRYSPEGQFLGLDWAGAEQLQVMTHIADHVMVAADPIAVVLASRGVGVA